MRTRKADKKKSNVRVVSTKSDHARPSIWAHLDWGRVRLWSVGIFLTMLWCALWGRAYYIQMVMGPSLAERARGQHMARETVTGVRGSIMDRNGNILSRSVDTSSVWLNPGLVKDKPTTAVVLAKILEVPTERITKLLQEKKRFVWVVRKVNDTVAKQIKEASLDGVYLSPEFERVYPYKTLAGQLLGFVNVDDQGIEGLEKAYNDKLSGTKIKQVVQRDARGRKLGSSGNGNTDLRGKDVKLTIDTQIQFFAEEALAEGVDKYDAKWGGCIVVDVPTGQILAWAQYPFFDPNRPSAFSELLRRNRLASDALEQGSTIKSFLIAAALEEKVVTPTTAIDCERGKWKIGRETIHDTHSYSILPVSKILHVSSNIGVAKIGFKLGAAKYYSYLQRLGFGKPTDLPLAGQSKGILRKADNWQNIDLAATSFGQSFSTTLVQMANAYLCLASDGMPKNLSLVLDEEEPNPETGDATQPAPPQEKIFSPETMRQVRAMLREVVEEEGGTGKQARIPGIVVGGKTGTAQKADRSGRYGSGRVGSFVGMVPIDNPRYLVCVLLDEPKKNQYGGIIAAPIFRDVALRTMAYHGLLPDSDDPLVKAIAEKEAQRRLKLGMKPEADEIKEGKNTKIVIAPNRTARAEAAMLRKAKKNNTVVVASPVVPSVVGLSVKQALEAFAAQGVMPTFAGKGSIVQKQVPEGGTAWAAEKQACTIWLGEI